jgi:hypothetical protein
VIVESHPALIGARLARFMEVLQHAARRSPPPAIEVAMGLETAHPAALARLNKGFDTAQFAAAAARLRQAGAALRVFVLVGVPFIPAGEQRFWVAKSVSFAFECGATVVSLIPTRSGNGALEALNVGTPVLSDLEGALEDALPHPGGRVFADLWDLERFADCAVCIGQRRARLRAMNLEQRVLPGIACLACGDARSKSV